MDLSYLADFEVEGLVRYVVVALFVLGWILGPLIKKLSSGSEQEGQQGPTLEDLEDLDAPAPLTKPVQPAHPVARPLPARPTAAPIARHPPTQPAPRQGGPAMARPAQSPPIPAPAVRKQIADRRAQPTSAPPQPTVQIRLESVRPPPGRPATPDLPKRQRPVKPRNTKKQKSTTLEQRMLQGDTCLPAETGEGGVSSELDVIRHPTPASLRHAIVLREVLGPPLALRPPESSL